MTDPTKKTDAPKAISDNELDAVQGAGMFADIGRALSKAIGGGVKVMGDMAGKAMSGIVGAKGADGSIENRGGDSGDGISGGGNRG